MPHASAQAPAVVHAPGTEPPVAPRATELPRQLGGWSALAVLLGAIIGSGIFRVPRVVAASTGSVTVVLLCWVVGGMVTLCGVLTVAELATMYPRAGGMYVYVREAYGRLPAFVLGWTDLVAVPAAGGAIALLFATYRGAFLPLGDRATRVVAAGLILLLAVVNYRSMRLAARLQAIGTPAKVLALVLLAGFLFAFGQGGGAFASGASSVPTRAAGTRVEDLSRGMVGAKNVDADGDGLADAGLVPRGAAGGPMPVPHPVPTATKPRPLGVGPGGGPKRL